MITELVLWSLNYGVFSELYLLTEKKIEANGYGKSFQYYVSNLVLTYVRC